MDLKKYVLIDQITITENGIVLMREVTRITEGDVELSKSYHRYSLEPGQDISGQSEQVKAICSAAWTPEVISSYKDKSIAT